MNEYPSFEIKTYDYMSPKYSEWTFSSDYHFLYILENGQKAYIGETQDIIKRSREHKKHNDYCHQFHFQRIHVITSKAFEGTPAKHYERLLIALMTADNLFQITNKDPGQKTHYQRKNMFELGFDRMWLQLEEVGLVRHREFQCVVNDAIFKYSPYNCLNQGQYLAMSSVVNAIVSRETMAQRQGYLNRPILIEGDAGTGKTVVASSLFHYFKSEQRFQQFSVGLVYANPATRDEMKNVLGAIDAEYKKDIISPVEVTKKHYDILICDEAHRLRRNKNLGMYVTHFRTGNTCLNLDDSCDELDWILTNSDYLILLYDKKQIVAASDIPSESFFGRVEASNRGIRPVLLEDQMRIRAGERYVPYIYNILHQTASATERFQNYEFKMFTSFHTMVELLNKRENQYGLCRLCGGYGWKWISKDSPKTPDISMDGVDVWWNGQTGGWLKNLEAKAQMGSIYSLPGLDLNYAAVVIGPELYFDRQTHQIKVDRKRFFDNKVKRGVTDDELIGYVLNTYGVLMTRGIHGTYVYVCDDALRQYLETYIPSDTQENSLRS